MIRTIAVAGIVVAVVCAAALVVVHARNHRNAAERAAEEAHQRLAAEREGRRLAEERYTELKREKTRSNGVHKVKEEEAEARISTLTLLSISAVVALTVVILLLARECSLRRVVNAALLWMLGKEADHGS